MVVRQKLGRTLPTQRYAKVQGTQVSCSFYTSHKPCFQVADFQDSNFVVWIKLALEQVFFKINAKIRPISTGVDRAIVTCDLTQILSSTTRSFCQYMGQVNDLCCLVEARRSRPKCCFHFERRLNLTILSNFFEPWTIYFYSVSSKKYWFGSFGEEILEQRFIQKYNFVVTKTSTDFTQWTLSSQCCIIRDVSHVFAGSMWTNIRMSGDSIMMTEHHRRPIYPSPGTLACTTSNVSWCWGVFAPIRCVTRLLWKCK